MSLLTRRKVLLAKLESVYGTDPTPTGSANAMLVKNLDVQPLNAELVNRDLVRDFLGNSDTLVASRFCTASFETEMVGSGVVGKAPAFDPLLKASGFDAATTTIVISSINRTLQVATVVTAVPHGLVTGDMVQITGATETEYDGTFAVTVSNSTTFDITVTGTPTTPATGSPLLNTATVYTPVSTNFKSVTMYFNVDGVLHRILGALANVEVALAAKAIPTLKFTFTGLYVPPSDTAAPTPDYSGFALPQVANTANTPNFSLFGYQGVMESMAFNMANDVKYRTLIGLEEVKLVDRKPAGNFIFEATTIATKDYFTAANDGVTGVMSLTHGSKNGFKVKLDAPRISIGNPQYQDLDGVQMLNIPFTASPVDGNDELTITFK